MVAKWIDAKLTPGARVKTKQRSGTDPAKPDRHPRKEGEEVIVHVHTPHACRYRVPADSANGINDRIHI